MLKENSSISEIYCEQFEDYLLKKSDKFIGVQVKTRNLDEPSFQLNDGVIIKAITKFVEHELRFPESFERFTFVTNSGFLKGNSQNSLPHVIEMARNGQIDDLLKNRTKSKTAINAISKQLACEVKLVIQTIAKIKILSSYSSLKEIKRTLIHALNDIPIVSAKNPTLSDLTKVADILVNKFFELSSLHNEDIDLTEFYLDQREAEAVVIENKRVDSEKIIELIQKSLSDPITLAVNNPQLISQIKGSNDIMELKMDKGDISFETVILQKDCKFSVEKHLMAWTYKYDPEMADALYNQIRLMVQTECQEAYDECVNSEKTFGVEMLNNVRNRLRKRLRTDTSMFKDLTYEHVLGITGILTEECKIWWSEKFDIA